MARISYDGFRETELVLGRFGRESIRRMVTAGGQAVCDRMAARTAEKDHVRSGEMMAAVGMTNFREDIDGGSVEVYPLGDDAKGTRNATKAFVTNYGRGGARGPKMGDRFITGDQRAMQRVANEAMRAEMAQIMAEARGGR